MCEASVSMTHFYRISRAHRLPAVGRRSIMDDFKRCRPFSVKYISIARSIGVHINLSRVVSERYLCTKPRERDSFRIFL